MHFKENDVFITDDGMTLETSSCQLHPLNPLDERFFYKNIHRHIFLNKNKSYNNVRSFIRPKETAETKTRL